MWDIYSIGDAAYLAQVFNVLAMIFNTDDIERLMAVGGLIGVLFAAFKGILSGGREVEFQAVVLGLVIYMAMFVPQTSVRIESTYTGSVRTIDNVPLGPAAIGSIISQLGYGITKLMETGFSHPKMTEYGFADNLEALARMRKAATTNEFITRVDGHVARSLTNYIKECTLVGVDIGAISVDEILRSANVFAAIKFSSEVFTTEIYVPDPSSPHIETCKDAYDNYLTTAVGEYDDKLLAALGPYLAESIDEMSDPAAYGNHETRLNAAATSLSGGAVTAQQLALASTMSTLLSLAEEYKYQDDYLWVKAAEVSTINRTRNQAWQLEQDAFAKVALPLMTFFEALVYALSPFMVFLIMLGRMGLTLVGRYMQIGLWVQLWMPMLAIVNLYLNMVFFGSMDAFTSGPNAAPFPSISSLDQLDSQLQTWMGVAGKLVASIPAIALMLLYGSAQTATHMAKAFDSSASAATTASGGSAPAAMRTAPGLATASAFSHTPAGGTVQTGMTSNLPTYSMGQVADRTVSSAQQYMQSANRAVGSQFMTQMAQGASSGASSGLATTLKESYGSDMKRSQEWAAAKAQEIGTKFGLTEKGTEQVQSAINKQIQAGGSVQAGWELPGIAKFLTGASAGASASTSTSVGSQDSSSVSQASEKQRGIEQSIKDLFKEGSTSRQTLEESIGSDIAESNNIQTAITNSESKSAGWNQALTKQEQASKAYSDAQSFRQSVGSDTRLEAANIGQAIAGNKDSYQQLQQAVAALGIGKSVENTAEYIKSTGGIADSRQAYAMAAIGVMSGNYGVVGDDKSKMDEGGERVNAASKARDIINSTFGYRTLNAGDHESQKELKGSAPSDTEVSRMEKDANREVEGRSVATKARSEIQDTQNVIPIATEATAASPGSLDQKFNDNKATIENRANQQLDRQEAAGEAVRENVGGRQRQLAEDGLALGAAKANAIDGDYGAPVSGSYTPEEVQATLDRVNGGDLTKLGQRNEQQFEDQLTEQGLTPAQRELATLSVLAQGVNDGQVPNHVTGDSGYTNSQDLMRDYELAKLAVIQEAGGGRAGENVATIVEAVADRNSDEFFGFAENSVGSPELSRATGDTGLASLQAFNDVNRR